MAKVIRGRPLLKSARKSNECTSYNRLKAAKEYNLAWYKNKFATDIVFLIRHREISRLGMVRYRARKKMAKDQ